MADSDRLPDRRRRRPRLPNARAPACCGLSIGTLSGCSLHRESLRIGDAAVPALTGNADIKLNTRLSLRASTETIASRTGYSLTHGRKAAGQNVFRPTVLLENRVSVS